MILIQNNNNHSLHRYDNSVDKINKTYVIFYFCSLKIKIHFNNLKYNSNWCTDYSYNFCHKGARI